MDLEESQATADQAMMAGVRDGGTDAHFGTSDYFAGDVINPNAVPIIIFIRHFS